MLRQSHRGKGLQGIGVTGLKVLANVLEEQLGLVCVTETDKVQVRVDEDGPQKFGELMLPRVSDQPVSAPIRTGEGTL
jgi:hypothetical protein